MTPAERLQQIVNNLEDLEQPWIVHKEDAHWLIHRVKRLTEALENIETNIGHSQPCLKKDWATCEAGCEFSFKARKALEGDE